MSGPKINWVQTGPKTQARSRLNLNKLGRDRPKTKIGPRLDPNKLGRDSTQNTSWANTRPKRN